jgi:hypothetical protein
VLTTELEGPPAEEGEEEERVKDEIEVEDREENPKGEEERTMAKDNVSSGTAASDEAMWEDAEKRSKAEFHQRVAEEQDNRQEQVVEAELEKVNPWFNARDVDESQGSQTTMDGHRLEERATQFTVEAELAHRDAAAAHAQDTDIMSVSRGAIPIQCATDGCRRTPWNNQLGQTCCRSCQQSGGNIHGDSCDKWALYEEGWDDGHSRRSEEEAGYRTQAEIDDIEAQADPRYDAIVQSTRAHLARFEVGRNQPQIAGAAQE